MHRCHSVFLAAAIAALALMPATAWSEDISGEWVSETVYKDGSSTKTIFEFNVDGSKVTGSVLSYMDEFPILNGKIKGDKVSFIREERVRDRVFSHLYEGKISGDTIKFNVTRLTGPGRNSKFTARRIRQ